MEQLDQSQRAFCEAPVGNIRLLAPAGCGKTISLLHRCRELIQKSDRKPRLLLFTFTVSAVAELKERLMNDPQFESVRDQTTLTTLNSYGWRRIRSQGNSPELLSSSNARYHTMRRELRPAWLGNQHVESAVMAHGRILMDIMDNLKSMGFVHTEDTNYDLFQRRLRALERQNLSWRIEEQFDLLTRIKVLDSPRSGDPEGPSTSRRDFYNRFFTFWRRATDNLQQMSHFTYEDQKYWAYLDIKSPDSDGNTKPYWTGAARYDHILVDEFQDINPLDLELIKAIAERNRATLTIVGDDDQAIFEWRGATPEYILQPQKYFSVPFEDYHLTVNYRSPQNIVDLSQHLIRHNENRVDKKVSACEGANVADIEIMKTDSIYERLQLVTDIVQSTQPGKVAVVSRLRRQLIPYQIYFASDEIPFQTAVDLDVFASKAFDDLVKLLTIWEDGASRLSANRAVNNTIEMCSLIRRRPFGKKDEANLRKYLRLARPRSTEQCVNLIKDYDGPKLSGKTHQQLYEIASNFLKAMEVWDAIRQVDKGFDGLQFDLERAQEDIYYSDPPLEQLASIAENEGLDVDGLADRIEAAKELGQEYRTLETEYEADGNVKDPLWERPLHLMTATRSKGKEFDTVILLDTVEGVWPYQRNKTERETEAERRLFYVAFTRAKQKVIMLISREAGLVSRFIDELGLSV